MLDLEITSLRKQFPILSRQINGQRLAYLDSAATTQKPQQVLEALQRYYQYSNANVHRGIHTLSAEATEQYEAARVTLGQWLGAKQPEAEIVFTKGATEALNLIAHGLGPQLQPGDEIVVSMLEHHANIVPWQQLAQRYQLTLRIIPINDQGELDLLRYQALLSEKTKVVAVNGISNALGTINPIQHMVQMAHQVGALFVCDATQMGAHRPIDVVALGCDFLVLSGHKMYGPTGIGLCYGKKELLAALAVYQTGGEMIETVSFSHSTFKSAPYCFEAGTPNIAGAVGWMAAVKFLQQFDAQAVERHETALLAYLDEGLQALPEIQCYSKAKNKAAVASFVVADCHPQDVATLLDTFGVAVRSGHHCAMPLMQHLKVPGLVRASLGLYSDEQDVQQLLEALPKVIQMLR